MRNERTRAELLIFQIILSSKIFLRRQIYARKMKNFESTNLSLERRTNDDSRKTDGRDARDREETNEEDQSNLITIFEISNKYSAL